MWASASRWTHLLHRAWSPALRLNPESSLLTCSQPPPDLTYLSEGSPMLSFSVVPSAFLPHKCWHARAPLRSAMLYSHGGIHLRPQPFRCACAKQAVATTAEAAAAAKARSPSSDPAGAKGPIVSRLHEIAEVIGGAYPVWQTDHDRLCKTNNPHYAPLSL